MKKISAMLITLIGVLVLSSSVFATEITKTSANKGFASAWELTVTGGSGTNTYTMTYGFNKFAIDEDYVHTYHNSLGHTAILTNGNGPFSDSDTAGSWARVDVVHSGSSVTYKMSY